MDKYTNLFEYFRQCPYLKDLRSIAGEIERGNTVILPQGASPAVQYVESMDVTGCYECTIVPYPSVYEDFQINCYELYDVNDNNPPAHNINALKYQQVVDVCNWVKEQNEKADFPDIGEQVVSIECNPFVPQVRYVDETTNTVGYFITVRIRYVNRMNPIPRHYEPED